MTNTGKTMNSVESYVRSKINPRYILVYAQVFFAAILLVIAVFVDRATMHGMFAVMSLGIATITIGPVLIDAILCPKDEIGYTGWILVGIGLNCVAALSMGCVVLALMLGK